MSWQNWPSSNNTKMEMEIRWEWALMIMLSTSTECSCGAGSCIQDVDGNDTLQPKKILCSIMVDKCSLTTYSTVSTQTMKWQKNRLPSLLHLWAINLGNHNSFAKEKALRELYITWFFKLKSNFKVHKFFLLAFWTIAIKYIKIISRGW